MPLRPAPPRLTCASRKRMVNPRPHREGGVVEETKMNDITQGAGQLASPFKTRYVNYIGGKFVVPV